MALSSPLTPTAHRSEQRTEEQKNQDDVQGTGDNQKMQSKWQLRRNESTRSVRLLKGKQRRSSSHLNLLADEGSVANDDDSAFDYEEDWENFSDYAPSPRGGTPASQIADRNQTSEEALKTPSSIATPATPDFAAGSVRRSTVRRKNWVAPKRRGRSGEESEEQEDDMTSQFELEGQEGQGELQQSEPVSQASSRGVPALNLTQMKQDEADRNFQGNLLREAKSLDTVRLEDRLREIEHMEQKLLHGAKSTESVTTEVTEESMEEDSPLRRESMIIHEDAAKWELEEVVRQVEEEEENEVQEETMTLQQRRQMKIDERNKQKLVEKENKEEEESQGKPEQQGLEEEAAAEVTKSGEDGESANSEQGRENDSKESTADGKKKLTLKIPEKKNQPATKIDLTILGKEDEIEDGDELDEATKQKLAMESKLAIKRSKKHAKLKLKAVHEFEEGKGGDEAEGEVKEDVEEEVEVVVEEVKEVDEATRQRIEMEEKIAAKKAKKQAKLKLKAVHEFEEGKGGDEAEEEVKGKEEGKQVEEEIKEEEEQEVEEEEMTGPVDVQNPDNVFQVTEDVDAEGSGYLEIKEGDVVEKIGEEDEDWWMGRLLKTGEEGLVPVYFLKEAKDIPAQTNSAQPVKQEQEVQEVKEEPAASSTSTENVEMAQNMYRVTEDVDAEGSGYLEIKEGDVVEKIGEEDEDWWMGRLLKTGEEGLVPVYFLKEAKDIPVPKKEALQPLESTLSSASSTWSMDEEANENLSKEEVMQRKIAAKRAAKAAKKRQLMEKQKKAEEERMQ
eukprot:TRINITY_DN432_c0_g1_i9.p1 TRINITY_DN432_c0_g1~~TRINITY_DN432_c0_g1_i9.p1  ORF type:complete len:786 (-),score=347.14 TRINITY_DN432_c0_g1_i9:852-3209(-)